MTFLRKYLAERALDRALAKRRAARPARHDAAIQGQRTYWQHQRATDPLLNGGGR